MKKLVMIAALCAANLAFAQEQVVERLGDLAKTTFGCTATALNAAARAVQAEPTQGMYAFSSFATVKGGQLPEFKVGFVSNHHADAAVNYKVTLYCQQGQDPEKSVKVEKIK